MFCLLLHLMQLTSCLLINCLLTFLSVNFPVQEEKRYYQMELVNRETNFNKVFSSADPKVGVLNPLAFHKVHVCLFVRTE